MNTYWRNICPSVVTHSLALKLLEKFRLKLALAIDRLILVQQSYDRKKVGREDEKEEVSSYLVTLKKPEFERGSNRLHYMKKSRSKGFWTRCKTDDDCRKREAQTEIHQFFQCGSHAQTAVL